MQPPASLKALGDPIYEVFYGLTEQPFAITTDPRFLYLSASHQRAFTELLNGLRRRESLLMLTGETGTGKTTLCRAVLAALGDRTFSAIILNPYMTGAEVLRIVLRDFGLVSHEELRRGGLASADVPQLLDTLEAFLQSLVPLGSHAVLVLDEAQSLTPAVLDQIRMLTGLEHQGKRLLQVVLCGQPGLLQTIKGDALLALNERITRRVELTALPPEDIPGYIQHRLGVAGGTSSVRFDVAAMQAVADLSRGLPRRINVLCDRALQEGRIEGVNVITADLVKRAARALAGVHDPLPVAPEPFRFTPPPPAAPIPSPAPVLPPGPVQIVPAATSTTSPMVAPPLPEPLPVEELRPAPLDAAPAATSESAEPAVSSGTPGSSAPPEPVATADSVESAATAATPAQREGAEASKEPGPVERAPIEVADAPPITPALGVPEAIDDEPPAGLDPFDGPTPAPVDLTLAPLSRRAPIQIQPESAARSVDEPGAPADMPAPAPDQPSTETPVAATADTVKMAAGATSMWTPARPEPVSEFLPEQEAAADSPSPALPVRELSFGVEKPREGHLWRNLALAAAVIVIVAGIGYASWSWDVRDRSGLVGPAPDGPPLDRGTPATALPVPGPDEIDALFRVRLVVPRRRVEEPPLVETPPEAAMPIDQAAPGTLPFN